MNNSICVGQKNVVFSPKKGCARPVNCVFRGIYFRDRDAVRVRAVTTAEMDEKGPKKAAFNQ